MPEVTVILLIFAGLMLVVAMIFGGIALHRNRLLRASQNWLPTDGEVVKTHITAKLSKRHRYRYYPHVTYAYQVNKKRYKSERLHFGEDFNSTSRARVEGFLEQYPVGMPVQVYYDLANPKQSVIERATPDTRGYWVAAGGWLVTALMVVALVAGLQTG